MSTLATVKLVTFWALLISLPLAPAQSILPAARACPATPSFTDVTPQTPHAQAIFALVRRGTICGYDPATFGPADPTLRAQMAALIARAMGWDAEDHGNPFPDQGAVDADLWRNVGTLAHYGVARGYQDGTYNPTGAVLRVQVVSFIARAMVAQGSWRQRDDDPALYRNVPASSGHRADLATYVHYAGALPDFPDRLAAFAGWDQPSTRAWFAGVLWQALTRLPGVYKLHGINFGPFTGDGQDPTRGTQLSEDEVRSRMAIAAPYVNWVRTFGCNLGGVTTAGAIARTLGLKIAMNAWLSSNLEANEQELACLIRAAKAGEVDIAIVGSETLLRSELAAADLVTYIGRVRAAIPAGIPVTTAEEYNQLLAHPSVIAASDLVMGNFYPFWQGRALESAMAALHEQYQQVVAASAGKEVLVSESGWVSCGEPVGAAIPSTANAAAYFINFVSWARANNVGYFYFELLDEQWKTAYEGTRGACWGIAERDGVWKPGMHHVFNGETVPDNWSGPGIPGGPGTPTIEFTAVPAYGSTEDLRGRVLHVAPDDHQVVVYIRVAGNWWTKPLFSQPSTDILLNGTWVCDVTTGGVDSTATELVAYLLPADYPHPWRPVAQISLPNSKP